MIPRAREDGLVMREVDDEVLVYDLLRHRAHSLNKTSALVWRCCNGETSVPELAARLRDALDAPVDERVVWIALEQLSQVDLLEHRVEPPREAAAVSRRSFMRKVGIGVVGGAIVLPVISTIAAPTAQAQGSVLGPGQCCTTAGGPGVRDLCIGGTCATSNCSCNDADAGTDCAQSGQTGKNCCINAGQACQAGELCCNSTNFGPDGKRCRTVGVNPFHCLSA
jgi:hypothetical protein